MKEEMMDIADFLHRTPEAREDAVAVAKIREEVHGVQQEIPAAVLTPATMFAVRLDGEK